MTQHNSSKSIWTDSNPMPEFSPLRENLEVDVCVVGGGMGGLMTAYFLSKENIKVCLIEASELASGQTSRTTAHCSTVLERRYSDLEMHHGEVNTRLIYEGHRYAIEKLRSIIQEENIECGSKSIEGYLFADEETDPNDLVRELESAHRAGHTGTRILGRTPIESLRAELCLQFSGQLQIHPLNFLSGITECIIRNGGEIFTQTRATEIHGGSQAFVRTEFDKKIHCKSIVVATNTPINDTFAIHTKQSPYRTYVLGFKVPKNSIPQALYWDTQNPYHYIRVEAGLTEDHEVLIVGGEDHKTGQDEQPELRFKNIELWTRSRIPIAGEVLYQWSGQVMKPVDGIAFLGRNPADDDNVYVITGDAGNGMTHCTIGASLITDQILGRENPWEDLYDPSRIPLRAANEFIKENANVAAQYTDWFSVKPKPDFADLRKNEGTVFRDGLKMVAVFKDLNGEMEYMSAACPHLGGVVSWNNVEKSWDCPCHGSRFNCLGEVIEGPANKNLKPLTDPRDEHEARIRLIAERKEAQAVPFGLIAPHP